MKTTPNFISSPKSNNSALSTSVTWCGWPWSNKDDAHAHNYYDTIQTGAKNADERWKNLLKRSPLSNTRKPSKYIVPSDSQVRDCIPLMSDTVIVLCENYTNNVKPKLCIASKHASQAAFYNYDK